MEGIIYFYFVVLAAFCPDPKSHIGQPVAFAAEVSSDDDDEQVADEEWRWSAGVTDATQLRKSL
jgi:hypothetical protein